MQKHSHYPSYDVMNEKNEWDDHTQSIVVSRRIREKPYVFLTTVEAEMLRAICSILIGDTRANIIQYVLSHMDSKLHQPYGEGQRKAGIPKAQVLVRDGLKLMEELAQMAQMMPFIELKEAAQLQIIVEISENRAAPSAAWEHIPQKELFSKLLNFTTEAYYSHPEVWSEIGYGGPAYPRGYVRTQLGQLDPWEAQPEHD